LIAFDLYFFRFNKRSGCKPSKPVRKSDNQIKCIRKLLPQAGSVRIALILSCSQGRGGEEEEGGGERHHHAGGGGGGGGVPGEILLHSGL